MDARTAANRRDWDRKSDDYQRHHGPHMATAPFAWGNWRIPEDHLRILGDVTDRDALELGCGAGHLLAALAERGARAVGLDLSASQLSHAVENARVLGARTELICGDTARLPFSDDSFDIVFSDHGAIGWADPRLVIPEVARVLRSGGLLAWTGTTPLHSMCWNDAEDRLDDRLHHAHADVRSWKGPDGTGGFHLSHGETVRLLVSNDFAVQDLVELQAPDAQATTSWPWLAPIEWALRWPTDEIWKARRS